MNIGTRIFTWLKGRQVGTDQFGNRYYVLRSAPIKKQKRWVMYKGIPEPSKIPPLWHRWLHYVTDEVPVSIESYAWQRTHLPNLTGTENAYFPAGHVRKGSNRDKATGDYQAWKP